MSRGKPQATGEMSWDDDKCLAKLRKRISSTSRRNRIIRFISVLLIVVLGIGILKEVAYWIVSCYR